MPAKRKPAQPRLPGHSESTEDHLERIAELVNHKGYARVSDVAEELGLTASTVSNMVRRLAARGFPLLQPAGPGARVLRPRHRSRQLRVEGH